MSNVIDFGAKRKESIEKKKRSFERVLYSEFIGSFTELDDNGTKYPVKVIDISKDGAQFQIPFSKQALKRFGKGESTTLRLYFTDESFIPAEIEVRHTNEYIDEKGNAHLRIGGAFDQTVPSFKALESFVNFLYSFAEHSTYDKGESQVYFL